jgi:hypothetical protein
MTKKARTLRKLLLVTVLAGLSSRACLAFEDEGFQWWTYVEASTKIATDWKATFQQEMRLGDDGGNFYYEHSDLMFTYSGLAKWLDVGAGFRLVYEKDSHDEWQRENRPHLDVTLKWMLFDYAVSSRSKIEYRDFTVEDKKDVWRYRNKFTAKMPFELTPLKLKPYTADEIFITLNDDNIDKNRLYFGVIMPLRKGVDLDIYYMWQASRSGSEWKDIEVLGTGLKFEF